MQNERGQAKDIESAYIESTLLEIQELKRNLVTQIAHNFRTPLTSVIGFAEMLLDDCPLSNEQRVEYARFIQYEGIRLSKLIDDVLELSALESGEAQLKVHDCVLQEVVSDAIGKISDFALGRFVTVRRSDAALPIIVRLDREKITQAIYQLLHNAIRFTQPNDEVVVTLKIVDDSVEISIQDGGPGIPDDDIPTLFEKANRVVKPEQNPRGTGVGLAIVKNILDLHKGDIQVQSKQGTGSLFTMRIPCIQE